MTQESQSTRSPVPVSRRAFLQSASIAGAAATPLMATAARALGGDAAAGREPLRELPYGAVRLTGGPLAEHHGRVHRQFLTLSNDSLLKVYRQRAGLPAPGAEMGGWYDLDGFVPGHTLGQYISGLARLGANTGDAVCTEKARALVAGFAETLGPRNLSILRPETNLWVCYTLDKHFAGLIDAHELAGMPEAKDLLVRVFDGAQALLPAGGRDRIGKAKPPYDETFVMPENLFTAARITGDSRFKAQAEKYLLNRELFVPLARGEDPLPGQHAYSHAIALSSAGQAYLTLGDAMYRDAMRQAFVRLTTEQQYASGGWGPNETFITPHRGELAASLTSTVDHFETPCGSYAATKLARYLMRTAEPRDTAYGDNLERVLFNTILVSRDPDSSGDFFYYTTYGRNATKTYYPKKWPCCSGTLVQTVADYPLNVYFASADAARPTLWVNLYTPSEAELTLGSARVRVAQTTSFPAGDEVALRVDPGTSQRFALMLRLPSWLAGTATVEVNGRRVEGVASSGSWFRVERVWKAGDTVRLVLPQDFRTEPIDDKTPNTVALMRGPVQYVTIDADPDTPTGRLPQPANLKPIERGSQVYVESTAGGRGTVLMPLYMVRSETYTAYFDKG